MPEKAESDKSKAPSVSRLQRLKDQVSDGWYEPDMPDVRCSYLLNWLFEIGPVLSGGMGAAPISNEELLAWQQNIRIRLSSWEARTILRLSRDYLNESQKAEKRDCPQPWSSEEKPLISLNALDTRNAIRQLAKL